MKEKDHSGQQFSQSASGGKAVSSKRGKWIALGSAVFVVLVVAVVAIAALGSKEPVAVRNDNDFLHQIYQNAIDYKVHTLEAGLSDEDLIAFGEDVCARGESGENWKSLSESAPAEELLKHQDLPNPAAAEVWLRWAVGAAAEFICPDQNDIATEQIAGLLPVKQN